MNDCCKASLEKLKDMRGKAWACWCRVSQLKIDTEARLNEIDREIAALQSTGQDGVAGNGDNVVAINVRAGE